MDHTEKLQHVLNQGKTLLDKGDVQGYWVLMSEHSGYARLAGEVASGKGVFAHIANARLQRAAKKNLDRELSDDEMSDLRLKIAKADQDFRSNNLKTKGHIGMSGRDTVEYHQEVFKEKDLPEDTYTPAHLQNIAGSYWSKVTGAPTHDIKGKGYGDAVAEMKRRFDADPEGFMDELSKSVFDALTIGMDVPEFFGDDKTLSSPFGAGHDPLEKTVGPKDSGPSSAPEPPGKTDTPSPEGNQLSSLHPNEKASPETRNFKPEQNLMLKDITKSDGQLNEVLAKDPGDWTMGEFVEVKKAMIDLPMGPEQARLDRLATDFLEDKYSTDPVKYDAIGRMIEPKPVKPINQKPVPAQTPDGEAVAGAVNRIGRAVADAAGAEGKAVAVQGLQSGLNLLKQIMLKNQGKRNATTDTSDLKTDGVAGPKTRRALRYAASKLGRPKVEESFALGRFGHFARDVQTGRDDTRSLKPVIDKAFGPLFRSPAGSAVAEQARPENQAFQATVNDLGYNALGQDRYKPIKEDGLVGPKTETAFRDILPAAGPDRFTTRLGHNLGFFDFADFG